MKALVTGGAGFIGSHLSQRLLADGWWVTCLDNFASGLRTNIAELLAHPRFTLLECDVSAAPLPDDVAADRYFHLASPASPNPNTPRSYMALPLETALVNSVGLQHVLDLAQRTGGRVLFASTSEIYGDPLQHPQREDYWGNVSSTGPRSCYDEAKRFGEALSMIYVRSKGVDVRLIRIFNTYGPNMDPEDGRMLPNFITQALTDKPLTIYGDGQFTRSLCYVHDLLNGLLSVMESDRADAAGRVYNLGNPEEHTILDYAKLVLELIPSSSSTITYLPPVPDDPSRRRPDIGRARSELSWEPQVPLREGVSRTIDYFPGSYQGQVSALSPITRAHPDFRSALWAIAVVLIGLAVTLPEPQDALLGLAGSGVVVLALIQPLVALPLLLFAVPFGGLARSSSGDSSSELSFGAAELLVALLSVVWLAQGVRRRALHVRASAIVIGVLAMVTLALLSIGYAQDRPAAIKESLKWLELLLVLVIVCDLARAPRAARWVIGAMLVAGAAEAAYGVAQFVTDSGPGAFALQGALRAFGHFDQPNPFAGYLTMMLPLAVCMALCRANPGPFRWLALTAAGLLTVGIGLSQSRGAWLGGAVAAVCLVLAWSRATRRLVVPSLLVAVLAVALAVAGLLPAAILDRLAQTISYFGVFDVRTVELTSENWAVVERMAHWQAGWYMFLDHPWLGVGAGNYAAAYSDYFVGTWRDALGHAHNYYLNILAELGVVGGGVLLLLLGMAFRQLGGALVGSETQADGFWRGVLAGVLGGLAVFCVHNLFDSLFVHSVNIQVGVLLGLGLLAADRVRSSAPLTALAR